MLKTNRTFKKCVQKANGVLKKIFNSPSPPHTHTGVMTVTLVRVHCKRVRKPVEKKERVVCRTLGNRSSAECGHRFFRIRLVVFGLLRNAVWADQYSVGSAPESAKSFSKHKKKKKCIFKKETSAVYSLDDYNMARAFFTAIRFHD